MRAYLYVTPETEAEMTRPNY